MKEGSVLKSVCWVVLAVILLSLAFAEVVEYGAYLSRGGGG